MQLLSLESKALLHKNCFHFSLTPLPLPNVELNSRSQLRTEYLASPDSIWGLQIHILKHSLPLVSQCH